MTYTPGVNGGRINASITGNTAGTASFISTGNLYLAGGNNVTLSQSSNTISFNVPNAASLAFSAGTTSSTFQTLSFQDANGVSFSNNAGGVRVTHDLMYTSERANYFYTSNNTFANSTHTHGNVSLSLSNLSGTYSSASNGLTVSLTGNSTQSVQSQNLHNVTLSGNSTSAGAGYAQISSGTMTLAGGTNITLSQNGNAVTVMGAGADGYNILAAGTQTAASAGSVKFADSNGIAFGMSNNSQITASYTVPSVTNSSWTVSDANTSATVGRLAFTQGNGITMSLSTSNNGQHTLNFNHALQYVSNTTDITAAAVNTSVSSNFLQTSASRVINLIAATNNTGGGTTSISGNVSFTNANNVTFYTSAGGAIAASISATQSNQSAIKAFGVSNTGNTAGNTGVSTGIDWVIAGSGSLTMSQSTAAGGPNTAWIQHPSWLVTAAQSNQVVNALMVGTATNAATNQTSTLTGSMSMSNINGMSFYTTASGAVSGIAASYTVPSVTNSSFSVQDSATTINPVARLAFSTGNNITLSLSTGASSATVGIAHNLAGISTGFGGNQISGSMTHNSSGLNLSLNHPAWLITAAQSSASNVSGVIAGTAAGAATNQSAQLSGNVSFSNGNGVTFFTTASGATSGIVGSVATTYLTSQSNPAFSAGAAASTFQTLSFQDANGVSFSNNAGGIRVTHDLLNSTNTAGITANALHTSASRVMNLVAATNNTGGGTTSLSSNVSFSNANGLTFYTSAGGAIAGSYTVPTQSVQTQNMVSVNGSTGAISFDTAGNVKFGFNASTVTASYSQTNQLMSIYAASNTYSTTSATMDARSMSFVGSGVASVGVTNGSVMISVPSGAAGVAISNSQSLFATGTLSLRDQNGITFQSTTGPAMQISHELHYTSNNTNFLASNAARVINIVAATNNTGGGTSSLSSNVSFSNANNVSFYTSAGGVIVASVAPPGAAAENNWVNLLGANTAGSTSASGSTIGWSGINLTLSGTNNSVVNISAPATSSLSATGAVSILTNAGTISIGAAYPAYSGSNASSTYNTATFANSNGVSFGVSTQGVFASVRADYASSSASNVSGVIAGTAVGAATNQSAQLSGAISFSNTNGVSFFTTANGAVSGIAASVAAGAADGYNIVQIGTTGTAGASFSASNGTLFLNGSNGISLSQTSNTINIMDNDAWYLAGNTAGASSSSSYAGGLYLAGGNNITLSNNGSTITISAGAGGGAGYTQLSAQNRQLGASGTVFGQNSVWLSPFRLVAPVSASTILQMVSLTGASSSNTGQQGVTFQMALYKNTAATNSSRFDTIWTSAYSMSFYISSSNSASYSINGGASGFNSNVGSANSNLLSQWTGIRQLTFNLNTTFDTGLYAFGFVVSTSSAGNSAGIRTFGNIIDSPMASGQGAGFGAATASSIGYVDGGVLSATSNAMPVSFVLGDIRQMSNILPYVKIGAV